MKKILSLSAITLLMLASVQPSFGSAENNFTIEYKISVVSPPCAVMTKEVNMVLDDTPMLTLANTNSVSEWTKGYSIKLSDCEAGAKVFMTIAGTPATNPAYFKNTGGDAQNIMVELAGDDDSSKTYSNGIKYDIQLPDGAVETTIPLKARLLNDGGGPAGAGKVGTVVTATFFYN